MDSQETAAFRAEAETMTPFNNENKQQPASVGSITTDFVHKSKKDAKQKGTWGENAVCKACSR
jgi:hypothetical protein